MCIFITQKQTFDLFCKSIDRFICDKELPHKLSFNVKSNNVAHKIYLTMHNGQIRFKNLETFAVKYVRIFL